MKEELNFYIDVLGLPIGVSVGGIVLGFALFLLTNLSVVDNGPTTVLWALLILPLGVLAALFCLYGNFQKHKVGFWRATRITFAFLAAHWVALVSFLYLVSSEGIMGTMSLIDIILLWAPASLAVISVVSLMCSAIYRAFSRKGCLDSR